MKIDKQKEFVENVSHEIKTSLTIVKTNIESVLISKNIKKKEIDLILSDSKRSLEFMNKLTDDLLLLSLAGRSIKKERVNLKDALNKAKRMSLKVYKGVNFKINIHCSYIEIMGSIPLLVRAFQNIIDNSIKYSKGDSLDIEVNTINKSVNIVLCDNGIGIPKKYEKKIFERFFRVDKSKKFKGSGLGLAISKEIFQKHGGDVKFVKKSGCGATFEVVLPII